MKNSEKSPAGNLSNNNQNGQVVFWLCTWVTLTIGAILLLPTSTPTPWPKGRLRAHGTVLVCSEGTITSVEDLWSGYLLSRSAGDLACGIQRDGSYFESPNTGKSDLHFRRSTFFSLITSLL